MKKLIMTTALLLIVLPTFAGVGEQSDTNCAAISDATHQEAQSNSSEDESAESTSIDG